MVLVEELDEEVEEVRSPPEATGAETQAAEKKTEAKAEKQKVKWEMKKGFLESSGEALYPPEGSHQGEVSDEVKAEWMRRAANDNINDMTKGKVRPEESTDSGPALPPPPWYTKEWPKDCQYNRPDCTLYEMDTTGHKTEMHRDMVRNTDRWKAAISGAEPHIRLSFTSLTDEDVLTLLEAIKTSEVVTEMDLSHNDINDVGVQHLVAALANAETLPNLTTLRLYKNAFTALGETMVSQGLSVFRPKLKVQLESPLAAMAAAS